MYKRQVFATSIRDQALAAAEEAAVILFVVDGSIGVTEEDESVARMVRKLKTVSYTHLEGSPSTRSSISIPLERSYFH